MEKLVIEIKWFYLIGENEFERKLTILGKEAFVFIDDFKEFNIEFVGLNG